MTPIEGFWLGIVAGAVCADIGFYVGFKIREWRKNAYTLRLLKTMNRHPAGTQPPRARYYPDCGHIVVATDPYELVIHTIEHREHCKQDTHP